MSKLSNIRFFIWTMVVLLTVTMCFGNVEAAGNTTSPDDVLSLRDIENNAKGQVHSIAQCQKNGRWRGCRFGKKIALFDSVNQITAYYFELTRKSKNRGYIIVDAKNLDRIIEYSEGRKSFLQKAKQIVAGKYHIQQRKQKVYYLEGMSYVIGGTNKNGDKKYIDVTTRKMKIISGKKWNNIRRKSKQEQYVQASLPDGPRGGIIDICPNLHESGYERTKRKTAANPNLNFFYVNDFSKGSVCAPTAATNLMLSWYNRGAKYRKLRNGTWKKTFQDLYRYMGTSKSKGTKNNMVAEGCRRYLSKRGYKYSVKYFKGSKNKKPLTEMMKEFEKDRPCLLLLNGHSTYGNHAVLAVGYIQFLYKNRSRCGYYYETYIRINDGYSSMAQRYVWARCNGQWSAVSMQIK